MLYVTTHTLCSVNVFYVSVSTSSFQRPGDDGMYGEYDVDHDDEEEEEAEGEIMYICFIFMCGCM